MLGAILVAFVVGFAAAQYLAYPLYHAQNRLILAQAVPVPAVHPTNAAPPSPVAHAVDDKVPARDIALTRLIASSGTAAGRQAPSLSLPDLDGTEVSLDAMRGKIVLLNFWATWCGPCRSEMPSLERLYQDFNSDPDFALLTVSTDQRGTPSVERFMARNGYDFPVLLDTENVANTAYGVSGLPTTFVIGRDGRIIWNYAGPLDWSIRSCATH